MTCEEWQQQLVLTEDDKSIPPNARLHLAECGDCREFIRENERLRASVRKLADSERAPLALRENLENILKGRRGTKGSPRRRWTAAAAAVVFLALAGYGVRWYSSQQSRDPDRLAQEFIRDHLHYLPGREQIVSASPQEVEKWFQGQVDFPVSVPQVPGAALEDARICTIAGRKAALLHYRHEPDDTLVSLFVAEGPGPARQPQTAPGFTVARRGCNAALWFRHGLVYALVGVLGEEPLNQMAASVRQQQP